MKVKRVSALRSESGLHRVSGVGAGALAPVVGFASVTTDEGFLVAMKIVILRSVEAVQNQLGADGHAAERAVWI